MALANKKRTAPARQRGDKQGGVRQGGGKQRGGRQRSSEQPAAAGDAAGHQMTEDSIASLNKLQARFKGRKPVLAEITEIIEDARTLQEQMLQSIEQENAGKLHNKAGNPQGDAGKPQHIADNIPENVAPAPVKARPVAALIQWFDFRKVLKSALGLLILVYIGWQPLQRLFQVSSVEAVVNAHLITLRSPIEGTVTSQLGSLSVGDDIAVSANLFKIDNPRAEHPRFDDLRRQIAAISDERLLDKTKLRETNLLLAQMDRRAEMFRKARISQIQSRINAEHSEIDAAVARHRQTRAHLDRQSYLLSTGTVALSKFQEAVRDVQVAEAAIKTLERRMKVMAVELEALNAGVFVGDSYNDIPYSSQRSYDLQQKLIDLRANIERNDKLLVRLQQELAEEEKRARRLVEASIVAPRKARVWEVLTAPGEQVNRGQELVRLLDCSLPVVTAAVTETVYNSLSIGAEATFRYRQTGDELPGRVVQMTGVASAPANLAIIPNALKKEAYRVMVKVPGLAERANCAIGQTGRVIFNDGNASATGATGS